MRVGLVMPLAGAALAGAMLGSLAPAGLFETWALVLLFAVRRRIVVLLLLCLAVVAVQVLLASGAELPRGLSRQDLALDGRITAVETRARLTRLRLEVEHCRPLDAGLPGCERLRRVRLTVYDAPPLVVGERWSFGARLRPPGGFANPGAFDYRAWLWREGIGASGYALESPAARRLSEAGPSPRALALAHLDARHPEGAARRWLAALTLGVDERLTDADWALLGASGTTHLMVISGLHVGLVAAFALLLARGVARLTTPRAWRLAVWPWWLAAAATFGYAGLAGFEPPALRALIMSLVGLWVASGRHAPGAWQGWWLALALVVLVEPLSPWRPGLWLSFAAVAVLILIWQGRERPRGTRGWLLALLRTQLLLALPMAAAGVLAFDRLAPAAPLVNLLAVPLVGSLMVPLGLVGWLTAWLPPLSALCWWLFGLLATGLRGMLALAVAGLPAWAPASWQLWPLGLVLALAGLVWALPGVSRGVAVATSLALLALPVTLAAPEIPPGQARVRVYDVGQGQAIEVRTANYRLLYDAGPRFLSGYMPLAGLWPPEQGFDTVIVSHADLDHAGGVPALAEHRVAALMAPRGAAIGQPFEACHAGQRWRRDGVTFRLLWPRPGADAGGSDNDRSCVLVVEAGGRRLLVTGDIGREAERRLLVEEGGPVTVLVAGHHGSRGSSGPQFVAWLSPRHVIFSAGRDNRFGHPAAEVVRRFRRQGSCLWSTAHDGAVSLWLRPPEAGGVRVEGERRDGVDRRCHGVESRP